MNGTLRFETCSFGLFLLSIHFYFVGRLLIQLFRFKEQLIKLNG